MKINHQNLIHPEKEENTIGIKKVAMRYLLYWACLGLVVLGGCKSCDREEACPSTRRTNANFKIEEYHNSIDPKATHYLYKGWVFYDSDTVVLNRIRLTPEDMNAERYLWIIGADTFANKQPIIYGFTPQPPDYLSTRKISITLTTWKKPDRTCFPDDSGKAVVTRMLTARHYSQGLPFGKWRVVFNNNPNDTSSFTLGYYFSPPLSIEPFYSGTTIKFDGCSFVSPRTEGIYGYRQGIFSVATCNPNFGPVIYEKVNFILKTHNEGSGQIQFYKAGDLDPAFTKQFKAYRILP